MKALCFGDAHIGAGASYGVLPGDRVRDQEAALERLVDIAIELSVDCVLCGGDIFDGPSVTPEHYSAFQTPMRRLKQAGIPIIACTGNGRHDLALRDVTAPAVVADVCEVFGEPGIRVVGDTWVCLLPWVPINRLVAAADGGNRAEVCEQAADMLISIARGLRAQVPAGASCVLVTHFSISGASLPTGLMTDALREVVLPLADLQALGFDAVVASHIHQGQYVIDETGWIEVSGNWTVHRTASADGICFYTSSLLPVDFGESKSDHGVWLVETGEAVRAEFIPITSRAFVTMDVDFTDGEDFSMLMEDYGDWSHLREAVVKVRYKATADQARRVDHAKVTDAILAAGASKVYSITADVARDSRARMEGVDETLDAFDALHAWTLSNETDGPTAAALHQLTRDYLDRLSTTTTSTVAGGLNPIRVRARGYRTFADLDYTFDEGFSAFVGDNGAGKSSTINLVDVCLFAGRGELADLLRTGEDSMEISLEFESAGDRYRVRRSLKRGKSQTVDLEYRVFQSPEQWEPISLESADATNGRIVDLIGLSRATFRASVFLRQRDRTSFTDCGAAARKHTLIEIIGLEEWERLLALAKADVAKADVVLADLGWRFELADHAVSEKATVAGMLALNRGLAEQSAAAITVGEGALEAAQHALAGNEAAVERVKTCEAELTSAQKEEQRLRAEAYEAKVAGESRSRVQEQLAQAAALAGRVPELEARVTEMREQKSRADAAIANRQALADKAKALAADLERRTLAAEAQRAKANDLQAKAFELSEHPSDDQVCERCEQHLGAEARVRAVASYLKESAEVTAAVTAENEPLAALARETRAAQEAAESASVPEVVDPTPVEAELVKARTAAEARATLAAQMTVHAEKAATLPRVEQELAAASRLVTAATAALDTAKTGVGDIDALAAAVNEARRTLTERRANADGIAAAIARDSALMERIEAAQTELKTITAERETVQTRLDVLLVACKAYGRDGVPALIVENSAIPQIEDEANRILGAFETAYRIELRTQREQKSGDLTETLEIVVFDGVDERKLETYSEGEKTIVALACRLGLAKLLRSYGGRSAALILDEPEFLSEARALLLVDVLRALENVFDPIVLITHNPAVAGSCDRQVRFVKTNDTSRIEGASRVEVETEAVAA